MTLAIPELWSPADHAAVDSLVRACAESDLLSALVAIEALAHLPSEVALRPAEVILRSEPEMDAAGLAVAARIAELSVRARLEVDRGASGYEALVEVLVSQETFVGDTSRYFAPENSLVSSVMARKKGQPILLSCVWILVGRGAGIDVVGLGFPGHFLVTVEGHIVDPFGGGRVMGISQLKRLAEGTQPPRPGEAPRPFDKAWLEPVGVPAIAARILRNLAHAFEQREDPDGAYRALRALAAITPDDGQVQVAVAQRTEDYGAWPEALSMYRKIARSFKDRREGQIGELKVIELESKSRILN
jgi:regulator of sirC expression with transglutaminase-like and TPR domain